jgi:hypothetical protein
MSDSTTSFILISDIIRIDDLVMNSDPNLTEAVGEQLPFYVADKLSKTSKKNLSIHARGQGSTFQWGALSQGGTIFKK